MSTLGLICLPALCRVGHEMCIYIKNRLLCSVEILVLLTRGIARKLKTQRNISRKLAVFELERHVYEQQFCYSAEAFR